MSRKELQLYEFTYYRLSNDLFIDLHLFIFFSFDSIEFVNLWGAKLGNYYANIIIWVVEFSFSSKNFSIHFHEIAYQYSSGLILH